MVGVGHPCKNFADTDPLLAKHRFSIYFARSASAVTPMITTKKVQLTVIGRQLRAFQWA